MKPFAALDQVLNAGALTPPAGRGTPGGDFQPLFAPGARTSPPAVGPEGSGHEAPQIELVEEEGHVQQIIVTCRCGERTVLDCAY